MSNGHSDQVGRAVRQTPAGKVGFLVSHYDAVGRAKASFQAFGPVPGGGQLPGDISASIVLEESGITYDAAGNQIAIVSKQRFDNATGTGALGNSTLPKPLQDK